MTVPEHQRLLIVDFGSQVTQLIARRVREARLLRDPPLPQGRRRHPRRRSRPQAMILSGGPASVTDAGSPRARARDLRPRRPGPRHLLRPADMMAQLGGKVEGGHAASSAAPRSPRPTTADPLFTGLFAGRARGGLDEPRRPRHRARPGLLGDRRRARTRPSPSPPTRPRHFYGVQFHPEVAPHRNGARILRNFTDLAGFTGDWTMAVLPRPGDRGDPRPGRRRQGDLRPLRRRRFLGRGGADPRGDRRPAHLRLRRHRPAAPGRGRAGRHPLPRPLQHPADPRRRARPLPRRARGRHRPRDQAQDHRPGVHRGLRRRARPRSATRSSSPRARSTPTSSRASASPAARRRRSRATTTSAACPSA